MLSDHSKTEVGQEPIVQSDVDMFDEGEPLILDHSTDVDTIILSDLHLGSDVSRSERAGQLLRCYTFRRLILNGDVFDDLNFKRLDKGDWRFLSYIRKLSAPRKDLEVIWVVGNHDGGVADILSHLLGVPVHDEYAWTLGEKVFVAIHGHQFDKWITEHQMVTAVATKVYSGIQKIDPRRRVSRWVKRTSKKFLRLGDKIGADAVAYAKSRYAANVVFCGHTHQPMSRMIGDVLYVNSGAWTDVPSTYITIDHAGDVCLRECR
jgi:UDP-2,3-diacylglucosamine pyrophosphatase LpxH